MPQRAFFLLSFLRRRVRKIRWELWSGTVIHRPERVELTDEVPTATSRLDSKRGALGDHLLCQEPNGYGSSF